MLRSLTALTVVAVAAQASAQSAFLKAPNAEALDEFGSSVAVSGSVAVVGAPGEDSDATGVNGNAASNAAEGSGAAYVLELAGGTWSQGAFLKASNAEAGDRFGETVAISGDTIAIGAIHEDSGGPGVNGNEQDNSVSQAGAVYVFRRSGGTWVQEAYLKASVPTVFGAFGWSLDLEEDTLVIGALAPGLGSVYVFERSPAGTWSEHAVLQSSRPGTSSWFGSAVGVSGDVIVVGDNYNSAPGAGVNPPAGSPGTSLNGAAFVYERLGGAWVETAFIKASYPDPLDQFGISVAVDQGTIVVGANRESSGAVGLNGDPSDNSAFIAGAAYVFRRGGAAWQEVAYIKPAVAAERAWFGTSVALDGDTLVVGAAGEKSAATEINGDPSDTSLDRAGAAFLFQRSAGTWRQTAYLKAPNPDSTDQMGSSCDVSDSVVLAGAFAEDGSASSGPMTAFDNASSSAGAAYAYELATLATSVGDGVCTAVPNPTGVSAALFAVGSALAQENDLTLMATGLPPGTFGFLVTSQEQGFRPAPGGSAGDLCIASAVMGRYNFAMQTADPSGRVVQSLDLTRVPDPDAFVAVLAGETRYWQLWYRMATPGGALTSNFSSAIRIQFQ